ncbi:MAG TPA: NAD(P)-dependent oxidoreductase [Gemmatimonadaceae bacterium]|nr:NAD(P)-dependent oxidoreductase [Gemmatimonadaceae bacterium]
MSVSAHVAAPRTEDELDDKLSEPRDATVAALRQVPGDIIVLGAGGKMGPTLARMAARAAGRADDVAGKRRVIAVSRFTSTGVTHALERNGVDTIQCDLLDPDAVRRLPDAPNVIFMAGQKFGTSDAPSRTWMMNVVVPEHCARRYASSRIVAFSTGNVYPLVPVASGGASERTAPAPVGEYAASCLGRERVFEYFSATVGTRVALVRLNYAIDLRYGVLTDLAMRIVRGEPVPVAMGHVNVIWQGDANQAALELLPRTSSPPLVVNVSGATTLSVRELATRLAQRLGREARFEGTEARDALLSDTSRFRGMFGDPAMSLDTMLDWVADWVREGRPLLGKPTHFETRDGAF